MTNATLGSANRAAASSVALATVDLLDIALPSGTLRYASGERHITAFGQTYFANGVLGEVPPLEYTDDLKPRTVSIELSGCDDTLLTALRGAGVQYSMVNGWKGFLDDSGALLAAPYGHAQGLLLSSYSLSAAETSRSITLDCESVLIYLGRNASVLATDNGQRARATGDTAFSRVVAVADQIITWGGQRAAMGTTAGRSGLFPLGRPSAGGLFPGRGE